MAWDFDRFKRAAVATAIVVGLLSAGVALLAFALAFRPCRVQYEVGDVLTWKLRTVTSATGSTRALPSRIDERELTMVVLGEGNEVALIAPRGPNDPRDALALLRIAPNGDARRLDAAGRPLDSGVAIGFFDFNLLPLPMGGEQAWDANLTYAVPPPASRLVQARVKRLRSGARTEFQLRFPAAVEWVVPGQGYQQVRHLQSVYTYALSKRTVEHASITLEAGVERPDGIRSYLVAMKLDLTGIRRADEEPARLRSTALACVEAQDALAADRRERFPALLARLRGADAAQPRLRALAMRLADELADPAKVRVQAPAAASWVVQLASGSANHRSGAERLVAQLTAAGWPAFIAPAGDGTELCVLVGRYRAQDPQVLARLQTLYPGLQAEWVEAP